MKKFKKPLTLNRLVISKLTNTAIIKGGSELNCGGGLSRIPFDPNCNPPPPDTNRSCNCPSDQVNGC
jgi:hypothetical protein